MAGIHAFIAQGAAADDLSCLTVTEATRPPSLCCAQGSSFLTQATPAAMKADIPTDNGGNRWQAPVTGVQGADDDLPPGRAARDGAGQHQDAFRRDEGTDNGA